MTLAAESFVGRVLAVVSRRSPGFRPPATPSSSLARMDRDNTSSAPAPNTSEPRKVSQTAADRVSVAQQPGLSEATARWKSASADVRLSHRGDLLALADLVQAAHHSTGDFITNFARVRDLNNDRARALDLVGDLIVSLDRGLARDLGRARALVRDLSLDLALGLALDRDLDRVLALVRDLSLDLALAPTRALDRDLGRARALVRDLDEACSNLADAANDFAGADITGVDPTGIDLAWLRWDNHTQWPSREWADRMRRASVEHPPRSGTFTVLPETDRDPAENTLV